MATVVRVETRLLKEVKEKLKIQGHFQSRMSAASCIRSALALWLYHVPDLQEGRDQALEILAKTGSTPSWHLRGQVAKFSENYDWEGVNDPGECRLPEEVKVALDQSLVAAEKDREVPVTPVEVLPSFLGGPESSPSLPSKPPWEGVKRESIDDIYAAYPKHPIFKGHELDDSDPLRIKAIEVCFANVPQAVHQTQKMLDLIEEIYETYVEYKERKEE